MRNQRDLRPWHPVDADEKVGGARAHRHEPIRQDRQFLQHVALRRVRFVEHRVQCRDNRHAEVVQQGENVAAGWPAEDPVLVLEADDVDVADVEEVGRTLIRRQVPLGQFEPDAIRVRVPARTIVDRDGEARILALVTHDRVAEVRCERCDAAASREVITDNRDPSGRGAESPH